MWPTTRLTDLLNIEHPIIQAPMAGATTPAMASAVSNSGGLGSHGCAMHTPEVFRADMRQMMDATNHPINVNFFIHNDPVDDPQKNAAANALLAPYFEEFGLGPVPQAISVHLPFGADLLEAVLETRPAVASFNFGLPGPDTIAALKEAGIKILSTATTVREAKDLENRGCDAVIAQGWEAGGHRGTYLSAIEGAQVGTFSLVPQVVDALSVPVIAAGGIADGRGIAAAFALGASGVQIGTAFLNCPESATPETHKLALLSARDEDTRITKAFSGNPARGLNNRYITEMAPHQDKLPDLPLMNTLGGPLRRHGAKTGNSDFIALWSGQSAAMNKQMPAAELFQNLVEEAQAILQK
jgi:nitronate monooxygenase